MNNNKKTLVRIANIETTILSDFEDALERENLTAHINNLYRQEATNTINWLARSQYQHLGLSTRLLDWSYRWDVALFFALYDPAKKHTNKDAEVWLLRLPQSLIMTNETISIIQPNNVKSDFFFNHSISINENYNGHYGLRNKEQQMGIFWVQSHLDSYIPLESIRNYQPILERWIIRADKREKLMREMAEWRKIPSSEDVYERFEWVSYDYMEKGEIVDQINETAKAINHKHLNNHGKA